MIRNPAGLKKTSFADVAFSGLFGVVMQLGSTRQRSRQGPVSYPTVLWAVCVSVTKKEGASVVPTIMGVKESLSSKVIHRLYPVWIP